LGKDRQNATQIITVTHATMKSLTSRVETVGHKLYMDNFFSSPALFNDLHTRDINCCGTVRQNLKGMPGDSDNKTLKLKWDDTHTRVRDVLTAIIWEDK
jgi:sorbitol-specific phosphotransferase system component IIBC